MLAVSTLRGRAMRMRRLGAAVGCLAAALGASGASAVFPGNAAAAGTLSAAPACPDANVAAFGPNVCVFTDTMSQAAIQNDLNQATGQH